MPSPLSSSSPVRCRFLPSPNRLRSPSFVGLRLQNHIPNLLRDSCTVVSPAVPASFQGSWDGWRCRARNDAKSPSDPRSAACVRPPHLSPCWVTSAMLGRRWATLGIQIPWLPPEQQRRWAACFAQPAIPRPSLFLFPD